MTAAIAPIAEREPLRYIAECFLRAKASEGQRIWMELEDSLYEPAS